AIALYDPAGFAEQETGGGTSWLFVMLALLAGGGIGFGISKMRGGSGDEAASPTENTSRNSENTENSANTGDAAAALESVRKVLRRDYDRPQDRARALMALFPGDDTIRQNIMNTVGPDVGELEQLIREESDPHDRAALLVEWFDEVYSLDGLLLGPISDMKEKASGSSALNEVIAPGQEAALAEVLVGLRQSLEKGDVLGALAGLGDMMGEAPDVAEIERALARSKTIDQALNAIEADRVAPVADEDPTWNARTRGLIEQMRAVECLGRIAVQEDRDLVIAAYKKAGQSMLRRTFLSLVAAELINSRDGNGLQGLHDMLFKQNNHDVRISRFRLTDEQFHQSVVALIQKYREWNPDSPKPHPLEGHLQKVYARYGNAMDLLHRASDPPRPDEIAHFLGQSFEMLLHLNDLLLIHLDKPRSRKADLNREMLLQEVNVAGMPATQYEEFSPRVYDVPLVVRNFRVVAREIGVRRLDGVLVDGFHISQTALKPAAEQET
ncbi:MAG: hypothetical protein AAF570_00320, partial [Bacteroidota bacterium]